MAKSFYYQRTKRLQPTIGNMQPRRGLEAPATQNSSEDIHIYTTSLSVTQN
jgi:hypothetical protein